MKKIYMVMYKTDSPVKPDKEIGFSLSKTTAEEKVDQLNSVSIYKPFYIKEYSPNSKEFISFYY